MTMKNMFWAGAALALIFVGPARGGDIVYKPIDTNKFVVKPTRVAANLAAQTIDMVGQVAAGKIENNGYVKTINNLLSRKIIVPHTQNGPSALPAPNLYPSTHYRSNITPVMPSMQVRNR